MSNPSPVAMPHPARTPRDTLGVALITRNAARHLGACLDAVQFADDIVLLDQSSTDGTIEIAHARGARVVTAPDWPGFGAQKNRAIALLQTDWILVLDADEVVSATLATALQRHCQGAHAPDAARLDAQAMPVTGTGADGTTTGSAAGPAAADAVYALDRVSSFCGQWIQHAGWRPDIIPRVFRRDRARFSDDRVHERLLFDAPVHTLDGELLHYSYDNVDTVLRKIDQYAAEGARQRFERSPHAKPPTVSKAAWRAVWAFLRTYVLKRGFLDGGAGLMIAAMNAQTVFYRFLRLRERAIAHRQQSAADHAAAPSDASPKDGAPPSRKGFD